MKKIILFGAVLALSAISCAKDHTCTCTYTSSSGNATTSTTTLVSTTKGQAKANCVSTKQVGSNGATSTNDCKLS